MFEDRPAGRPKNPWLSMWVSPRKTIHNLVLSNPSKFLWLLSAIYGFPILLQLAQNISLSAQFSIGFILILSIILSPFIGFAGLSIISGLLYWTGQWIGGMGRFQEIRAAMAWANVPTLVNCLSWLLLAYYFQERLFIRGFPETGFIGQEYSIVFFSFLVQTGASIWSFVIGLQALGEVQGFSAWKALLNVLIPLFMIILFLSILAWLGTAAFGS